jgi:hypothetical protein
MSNLQSSSLDRDKPKKSKKKINNKAQFPNKSIVECWNQTREPIKKMTKKQTLANFVSIPNSDTQIMRMR